MATRTLVRLRSGYRIPLQRNEGSMMDHLLNAMIGESLVRARDKGAQSLDEAIAEIRDEVRHVAKTMDDKWVREFARIMLDLIVSERVRRDFAALAAKESGSKRVQ